MKKNIYLIVILFSIGIVFSSCEKYLEDEIATPNSPVEVTPSLLLSSAQVGTFATYTGQLVRQSCTMSQHLAGTDAGSQSIQIANYDITEATNVNEWGGIYSGALTDCRVLLDQFGETNPYYAGMAKVIMVLNVGVASDLWGDVPFSEAGLASIDGNSNPSYDSQASILTAISSMLDDAVSDLSRPLGDNEFVPTTDDLLFGGSTDQWIKMAYVIKARYANRLSELDPTGSADAVIDALNAGAMSGSIDDAFMNFPGGNGINQWFAFESSRGAYYRVNSTYADMLIANNDPRLSFFLGLDGDGGYSGTPFDDTSDLESSYIGALYATETSPVPLVTYVEQKFLEAEARFRKGEFQMAADAYNEAVIASVEQVTGAMAPASFVTDYASETSGSINLDKIMTQKWIALFIQIESYSDWRRTGIPALTANPNGNVSGIPLRLPTVLEERLYNSNATIVTDILAPVYWDQ